MLTDFYKVKEVFQMAGLLFFWIHSLFPNEA